MTKSHFIDAILQGILPNAQLLIARDGQDLPRVANKAAMYAFIHKIDDECTEVLRYQLQYLDNNGCFDFEK